MLDPLDKRGEQTSRQVLLNPLDELILRKVPFKAKIVCIVKISSNFSVFTF